MALPEIDHRLPSLREEVAALHILKCRMAHERVLRDDASGLPVRRRFPEGDYRRVGLCSPEQRTGRLGCSHSMARMKLGEAIKALAAICGGEDPVSAQFSGELTELDNAIHLLDHRKGEAEKRLAISLEEAGDLGVRKAEREINEMETTHDELVEQISRLRDRVVSEIDQRVTELSEVYNTRPLSTEH